MAAKALFLMGAVFAWALATALPAVAQAGSAPGPAPAAAFALDVLLARLRPAVGPYPDYFTEALAQTRFRPGARSKALKLLSATEPELLVLPVQMQAFGWAPGFAALVGAELDRALASRGQLANRQTDLHDADGPFVRRFDDSQVAAFAAAHARAPLLALYVGRDGAGQALLTLTLQRGGRLARAHRSTGEVAEPKAMLGALSALLPSMLGDLGLGATLPVRAVGTRGCDARDWDLEDLPNDADRASRACRALITGTLMPEFMWPTMDYARPKTPDKLAWLAQAYAESDSLAPAVAKAVRALAWGQLEIADAQSAMDEFVAAAGLGDPVVQPLARMLRSWNRTANMPTQSRQDTALEEALRAGAELPPFARAAFEARAANHRAFQRVDLCALELRLPSLRLPPGCVNQASSIQRRQRTGSAMERALLEGWRLARSVKDIEIEGHDRADPRARSAVLDALPERIAAHPFVRQMRFETENLGKATGSYASLVERAVAAGTDFVQTTADLQRWTSMLANNVFAVGEWARNDRLMGEPAIAALAAEEMRMTTAFEFDGYMARNEPPRRIAQPQDWGFLRPEPAKPQVAGASPSPATPSGVSPGAPPSPPQGLPANAMVPPAPGMPGTPPLILFMPKGPGNIAAATSELERAIASAPSDMGARISLALMQLKQGASVAQSRATIDGRTSGNNATPISESHVWAGPAHAYFFMGELDAARAYYERSVTTRTASESDLHARVRLKQMAGDVPAALAASRDRLQRYEGDFARRDVAGLEFMTGHADRAWAVLEPRLQVSGLAEMWVGVQVGQRLQGLNGRQVVAWSGQAKVGHARHAGVDITALHLHRYLTDDRVPSEGDVALLGEIGGLDPSTRAYFESSSRLKRLAFEERPDPAAIDAMSLMIQRAHPTQRDVLKPLYTWVKARAGDAGKDPSLNMFRTAGLDADFDSLVAKGLLLGISNQPAQALQYLRAARYELAGLSYGRLHEELRSAAYTIALADYLLFRRTGDAGYRDEGLVMARGYQKVFPFLAWPYALDALLSPEGPARTVAACRARYLDASSLFLGLSGLKPDPRGAMCRNALW